VPGECNSLTAADSDEIADAESKWECTNTNKITDAGPKWECADADKNTNPVARPNDANPVAGIRITQKRLPGAEWKYDSPSEINESTSNT
jgi:hypothetical protein